MVLDLSQIGELTYLTQSNIKILNLLVTIFSILQALHDLQLNSKVSCKGQKELYEMT